MADDAIGPRGNNSLTSLDSNRTGSETVALQCPKDHQVAAENECLRNRRQPQGRVRPAKPVIEAGEQEGDQHNRGDQLHDELLFADGFLPPPPSQPALD